MRINAPLCLKRLSALLMNATGKVVNNRSGFFPHFPSLLCSTRQTVPLVVQSLSSVSASTVPKYLAYLWIWVQVWIADTVAHTPWPMSSCFSAWDTSCDLQMMLRPVPGSLEGT